LTPAAAPALTGTHPGTSTTAQTTPFGAP